MKEKLEKERILYLDLIRIVAIFFVIVLHVSTQKIFNVPINSMEWNVFIFFDSISRWSVAAFVMISGVLFLNKEITIEKIYKKFIKKIILVFIFWSLFYAVTDVMKRSRNKTCNY